MLVTLRIYRVERQKKRLKADQNFNFVGFIL